ncbi:hypothetical protein HU200_058245 [Digitaria exilis]|uniref:Uncharacterized protein n=1 Tax=Digitaria exilis TaxID=1010633 RepID=A0A835E498_9POAL|nr:hypothetical protein HU200_058245 [Digitaria exilis]
MILWHIWKAKGTLSSSITNPRLPEQCCSASSTTWTLGVQGTGSSPQNGLLVHHTLEIVCNFFGSPSLR